MEPGAELACAWDENVDDRIAEHFAILGRIVRALGNRAESLTEYHALGIDKETIRRHIGNLEEELARFRALGNRAFADLPPSLLRPDVIAAWNSTKNLRYAAGSLMMTERFRGNMTPENRTRAYSAKLRYEVLLDALDDLIDETSYSFQDAFELMRHCLRPITSRSFDPVDFQEELRCLVGPEQRHLTDFLTALVAGAHRLIAESPHGREIAGALERFQANWILGEAYTMYQKDPTVDAQVFLAACDQFPTPDPDLKGIERISGWISHTAAITLLDLCFADRLLSPSSMEEHMTAWFYFDVLITLLNNVMDPAGDLDNGIANLFVIAKAKGQIAGLPRVRGIRPTLTMADYEDFLGRAAEFARRVLKHAAASGDDPTSFYPFIVSMAPVVMLTDDRGTKEDLLHAYLRAFAQAIESPIQEPSKVTIPPRTRSNPSRNGRIESL